MRENPPSAGERKLWLWRPFVAFSLLNVVLMMCTVPIYLLEPGGPGPGVYSKTWLRVFAFPAVAAGELGLNRIALLLLFVNPLFYGLFWTLAWRMWRLSRPPSPED